MEFEAEHRAVLKITDIVFEYERSNAPEAGLWLERWNEGPNPFYRQTASGLFLEEYYGLPSTLWTPWGKYTMGSSGSGRWDDAVSDILQRLGAVVHTPLTRTKMGEFGPVYSLHSIDGAPLPEPVLKSRDTFTSYEDTVAAWERITSKAPKPAPTNPHP